MGAPSVDVKAEDGSEATYILAVLENGVVTDIIAHSVRAALR